MPGCPLSIAPLYCYTGAMESFRIEHNTQPAPLRRGVRLSVRPALRAG